MEIKLKLNNNYKKINIEKFNIILGNNCSGKTGILNTIYKGLEGKEEYFLINGINVSRGMYEFCYIDEHRDIDAEIQLKTKSHIKDKVIKSIILNNEEYIEKIVEEYIDKLKILLQEEKYQYLHSNTKLDINENKMKKLDSILFYLLDIENMSKSSKEEFYFMQRLNSIEDEVMTIILIDDIDRYLDNKTIENIFSILENKNIKIICTSKNKYILNDINFNKIFNTKLEEIKLLDLAKFNMFTKYHQEEKSNLTLDDYIMINNEFFLNKDYERYLLEEKINIISKLKV